ncbi:MAG: hypothetical protein VX841_11415 [Pseudomonadota bacterium]|nr:hypothetical protein [Pseudomonadota bacterium]
MNTAQNGLSSHEPEIIGLRKLIRNKLPGRLLIPKLLPAGGLEEYD